MAQLIVRNLEDQLKTRLQRRAKQHGRSMEEEARDILRDALKQEDTSRSGLGTEIAALFREKGLEKDIPEIRGHSVTLPTFES